MLEAGFWGLVGGSALVIGALIGLHLRASQRTIGLIMGFGSGVLISALTFDLTQEAFHRGGADAVAGGLAAGALAFWSGNRLIERRGGAHRKRSDGRQAGGSASAIVLGAMLDGIPESVAVGLTLIEGEGVGAAFVVAVFLSNIPEALSAATGLVKAGHSRRYVVLLWSAVALVSALAAMIGFAALGDASGNVVAFIQAFAAGAILTMLADTMMPESFEDAGVNVGLVTVLGFAAAFLLSTLD